MKKISAFLIILSFMIPVFSQKLYLDLDEVFEKTSNADINFDSILEKVSQAAKEYDIEIIDYNSLELVPYRMNWGTYERAELESERLTKQKEKYLEKQKKINKPSYGVKITIIDGEDEAEIDDYIASLDKKIAAAKEKEARQIDPITCYPRIEMNMFPTTKYKREFYTFDADFWFNNEKSYGVYTDFNPAYLATPEEKETLIVKTIEAFFPAINPKDKKLASPSIIDHRTMTELGNTRNGLALSAIPRQDYSFVMRIKNDVYNFNSTWDITEDLTKKITGNSNATTYWQLYSPDGKNILFANEKTPAVLYMNEQNSITKRQLYKYPSMGTMLDFYNSGEPYLLDSENRRIILPQQGDKETEYMSYPTDLPQTLAGPDDTFYFKDDDLIFVYSAKTKALKRVIYPQITGDGFLSVLKVLNDGSFLAIKENNTALIRFSKNGSILWSMPIDESLMYSFCCGSGWGMYFLYDVRSNDLWRVAEADAKLPPALIAMKNINKNMDNATLSELAASYKANADVLYNSQSYVSALEYYNKYLEISPADPAASERKLLSEVAINKKEAITKTEEALDLFDEYGEETAREKYQEAMKLLEKLKKRFHGMKKL